MAYMNPLRIYSLLLQRTLHFMQSRCRIAVSLRAAIKDNYFHAYLTILQIQLPAIIAVIYLL